ncbi:hypothetical protein N7532_009657, partial [Penicillium argentinense]
AAFHGSRIILRQVSPESETIFDLILALYQACDGNWTALANRSGVEEQSIALFLEYAATFLDSLGNYKGYGDCKFIPRINLTMLEQLCAIADRPRNLFNAAKKAIYSAAPRLLGYPDAGNMSNYYPEAVDLTKDQIRAVQDAVGLKISLRNTRLRKSSHPDTGEPVYELLVASIEEHPSNAVTDEWTLESGGTVRVVYGDHADCLRRMCASLGKAREYATSDEQRNYLSELIAFYQTGDIELHRQASISWLADGNPLVETWSGFLEPGRDPSGIRCEFEALVAMKDKEMTAVCSNLVKQASRFILQLPWSGLGETGNEMGPFENEIFMSPNFIALNLLCYCASNVWIGLTAPGYPDIKTTHGRKNLTFSNRVEATTAATAPDEKIEWIPESQAYSYRAHASTCFFLQLVLHELIGHGCGKLLQETSPGIFNFDRDSMPIDPFGDGKPIQTWYGENESPESAFGGVATAYTECLAEGIGLYLMSVPSVLEILVPGQTLDPEEGKSRDSFCSEYTSLTAATPVIFNAYLSIARMGLRSLLSYDPENKKWGQVHDQARFGLLRCFIEAGDGFLTISNSQSDSKRSLTIQLDRAKIATVGRPALGSLIHQLHVFRCIKAVDRGTTLLTNLTRVEDRALEWRDIILANEKPRARFIHANTTFDETGEVVLVEYPLTKEGLIKSWADRQGEMTSL